MTEAVEEQAAGKVAGKLRALYELTKPGIAGYVMITAGVSYYVAARGQADFLPVTHTLVGVAPRDRRGPGTQPVRGAGRGRGHDADSDAPPPPPGASDPVRHWRSAGGYWWWGWST